METERPNNTGTGPPIAQAERSRARSKRAERGNRERLQPDEPAVEVERFSTP